MTAKKKWLIIIIGVVLMALLAAAFVYPRYWYYRRLHAQPRKDWKEKAIAEIARRAGDSNWLTNEITGLKREVDVQPGHPETWLTEHLILMTNGEWIVYANVCSKEDSGIHDLFIGRGSDGKWYYSTFHFCIGMLVLMTQEYQPTDLPQFIEKHYLQQFDGQSDECLKTTWPARRR